MAAVARRAAVRRRARHISRARSRPHATSGRDARAAPRMRTPASSIAWTRCAWPRARSRSSRTRRQESSRAFRPSSRPTGGCCAGTRAACAARRPGPRRELPVHAERRRAGSGTGPRARDLSQHRDRSRAQRLDVHRAGHHVDRFGSRVGGRRRARSAQGPAARRRARAGAGHGVRDRRARRAPRASCAGRSRPARS